MPDFRPTVASLARNNERRIPKKYISFIFERMNGFLKQSSCYELLFYITIVAKEKKWRKNLGVETTKKFIHSVNSSQVREWGKIQAFLLSIVVKICIRSKKEK